MNKKSFVLIVILFCNINHKIFEVETREFINARDNTVYKCLDQDKLIVTSEYLKFSSFVNDNKKLDYLCKEGVNIKILNIFSFNTVIIDKDLRAIGQVLQLNIIAPTWEIVGKRKIILDGGKGKDLPRARDGQDLKTPDGEDGEEGEPGGPGGNFFGIGENFINSEFLTISVNGGDGGKGQDGGHGLNGVLQGVFLGPLNYCSCAEPFPCINGTIVASTNTGNVAKFNCKLKKHYKTFLRASFVLNVPHVLEKTVYKVSSEKARDGGNGGDGGVGGKSGLPGNITVIEVSSKYKFCGIQNRKAGNYGTKGKGGFGGQPAKYGLSQVYETTCGYKKLGNKTIMLFQEECKNAVIEHDEMSSSGRQGVEGLSSVKGKKEPEKPNVFDKLQIINFKNEFISFLIESSNNTVNVQTLKSTLMKLEGNEKIKNLYSISEFIVDLGNLENYFHNTGLDINLYYFYGSLLNRISEHVLKYKAKLNDRQVKKVAAYLYTAVLGRIYIMEKPLVHDMVFGLKNFNDSIISGIGIIKNFANKTIEHSALGMIHNFSSDYKSFIENKTNDIENFKINKVDLITTNMTVKCINDITDLLKKVTKIKIKDANYKETENSALKNLKEMQLKKAILGSVNFLVNISNLMLTTFKAIFEAFENTSIVIEPLDSNSLSILPKIPKLNETMKALKNEYKSMTDNEIIHFRWVLEELVTELKTIPKTVDVFKVVVKARNSTIKNTTQVRSLRKEIISMLQDKRKNFANDKTFGLVILKSSLIDVIKTFERNQLYKSIFIKAAAVNEPLKKHLLLEEHLLIIVESVIINLKEYVESIASKVFRTSQHPFYFNELQIQKKLTSIKTKIVQMYDELIPSSDLRRPVEFVEVLLESCIMLFDRIHKHQSLQMLTTYYRLIFSSTMEQVEETNEKLSKSNIVFLETIVKSNIVLQIYKSAFDTYNSYRFPFSQAFEDDIVSPFRLDTGRGIEDLVTTLTRTMQIIMIKWNFYRETLNDEDRYTVTETFSSEQYPLAQSFFTWSNDEYLEMITELLSGKEVTIFANVNRSKLKAHAVKFNLINFNFKARDESLQEDFDDLLIDFKIRATHLGFSYYGYLGDLFLVVSNSHVVEYCFDKDMYSQPTCVGGDYELIKNHDCFISPFTLWKIQLIALKEDTTFEELEQYKDKVDLEVGGEGQSVEKVGLKVADNMDLKVNTKYNPINLN